MPRFFSPQGWHVVLIVPILALLKFAYSATASTGPAFNDKAKAELVQTFHLQGEEIAALNVCQSTMKGRRVPGGGGDPGTYCGCLAKRATEELNEPYKTNAIRFIAELEREGVVQGADVVAYFPDASFNALRKNVTASIREALKQCREEARDVEKRRRQAHG